MNTPLSTEAKLLLDDLITLSSFEPNYYETWQKFDQRRAVWIRIADYSESTFKELQSLIEPERDTMTDGGHREYSESRTNQIRNDEL